MLRELRNAGGTLLYVTHDLTVASQICDRLYIMYAGRIMEAGETHATLDNSLHPYTRTLIASVPEGFEDSPALPVQLGEPPNLARLPSGCKFNPRCPYMKDVCKQEEPMLMEVQPGRYVACWKVGGANGKYS
jgi:peptide/nickel transport system ATP-binding protein